MNNGVSISFNQNRIAQTATAMIGSVNSQIAQTAQLDDQPGMDSSLGRGSVLAQDQDSFVQLQYDPNSGAAGNFSFKALNDIKAPTGETIVPKGMASGLTVSAEGVETYTQSALDQDGNSLSSQTVINPQTGTITVDSEEPISFQQRLVAETASGILNTVNQQIAEAATLDEQPQLDTRPGAGSVGVDNAVSSIQLDYDPATRAASNFNFEAKDNIMTPDGQVVVSKGVKTSMTRSDDGVETYTQSVPMEDGRLFNQSVAVNPNDETLNYNEWIING